jgi:hypothetical protein
MNGVMSYTEPRKVTQHPVLRSVCFFTSDRGMTGKGPCTRAHTPVTHARTQAQVHTQVQTHGSKACVQPAPRAPPRVRRPTRTLTSERG